MATLTWNSPLSVGIKKVDRVSGYVTIAHDYAYKYTAATLSISAFHNVQIRERADVSDSSTNSLDIFDISVNVGDASANGLITTFWNNLLRGNLCTGSTSGFVEDASALFDQSANVANHASDFKHTPADAFDRCFARAILGDNNHNTGAYDEATNKEFERAKMFRGEDAWNKSVYDASCSVHTQFINDISNSHIINSSGAGTDGSGNVIAGLLNGLLDGSLNSGVMDSSGSNSRFKDMPQNTFTSLTDDLDGGGGSILRAGDVIYCALVILGSQSNGPTDSGYIVLNDLSGSIQTHHPDTCDVPGEGTITLSTQLPNLALQGGADMGKAYNQIIGTSAQDDSVTNTTSPPMVWRVRIELGSKEAWDS